MNLLEKIPSRLSRRISIAKNGCWEVSGFKDKDGYTFYHLHLTGPGAKQRTHRYTYQLFKGAIPSGLTIDHLCKNKSCCNPDHLEAVTQAENNRRAGNFPLEKWIRELPEKERNEIKRRRVDSNRKTLAAKTHCRRGHLREGNTYTSPSGKRRCQICFYNSPSMITKK